jgi:biopolymer transport protein TolQ
MDHWLIGLSSFPAHWAVELAHSIAGAAALKLGAIDWSGMTVLAQAAPVDGAGVTEGGQAIESATLGGTAAAVADMSLWSMFVRADIVVKAVMLILLLASFWSWAIIFEKVMQLRRITRRTDKFEDSFWSGGSVDDLYDRIGERPADPMSAMFSSAMREWRRSGPDGRRKGADGTASLQQRIERVMQVTLTREMDRLERFTGFLATVGSTAPFVGLFGTVWGIMNSFTAIAQSNDTSLAVVAPGIAEALFATALGLVAAIPAVIAYNKISTALGRQAQRLNAAVGTLGNRMARGAPHPRAEAAE